MVEFVCDYLSKNYYIGKSDIGNYGIYAKNDTRRYKAPFNGDKLLNELNLIFFIENEEIKQIVNAWANVDLEFYWKNNSEIFTTIPNILISLQSFDLVPVEPMVSPTGNLFYFDYAYVNTNKRKKFDFINNIYIKIKDFIKKLWKKQN